MPRTAPEGALPDLSALVPAGNENRWTDLLSVLVATDPDPFAAVLGVPVTTVHREVVVPGAAGRSDRLDLLAHDGGGDPVAAVEVKVLSDLGHRQLERYRAAFPTAGQYRVAGREQKVRRADCASRSGRGQR